MDILSFIASLSFHLDAGTIKFAEDDHGMHVYETTGEQARIEYGKFTAALRAKVQCFRADVNQFLAQCKETDVITTFGARFKDSIHGDLYEVVMKSMRSFPPTDISRQLAQEYIQQAYSRGEINSTIVEVRGELPPASPAKLPARNS